MSVSQQLPSPNPYDEAQKVAHEYSLSPVRAVRAKLRHAADVLDAQMLTCPGCGSRVSELGEISSGQLGVRIQRCARCVQAMAAASGVTL